MATTEAPQPELTREMFEQLRLALDSVVDDMAAQLPPSIGDSMREVIAFRRSITEETDRGAVLMASAFLDDKLRLLLKAKLVQDQKVSRRLFEFNGPLGTYSARIDFAYLLGLIPKNARRDLHTIRKIRNEFAHYAAPLGYEDGLIAVLCAKLIFHGVRDVASPGSKFRRSVMGLLAYLTFGFDDLQPFETATDYVIADGSEQYKFVSSIFEKFTGMEFR